MNRFSSVSYTFTLEAPIETVFDLFSQPSTLNSLTPRWFDLAPRPESPLRPQCGDEIRYRLRWHGLPLSWTSRITEWNPPDLLTYEQARGPYRFFRHMHRFRSVDQGTEVVDHVDFRAPGGWAVDTLVVKPELKRIFRHRAREARRRLGEDSTSRIAVSDNQAGSNTAGASLRPLTNASSSIIDPPT